MQSLFEVETFSNHDYSANPLPKGEYDACSFLRCKFAKSDLSGIRFIESRFEDCDLSNADISNSSFQDVIFINCKMPGLQFDGCNDFGFSVLFENCRLDHSTFFRMKLNNCSFQHSQLEGVDFTEADLKNIKIRHCDLLHATFDRSILEKTDLRNSYHYSIDPENNVLKGARFSLPEVIGLLDKYGLVIDEGDE